MILKNEEMRDIKNLLSQYICCWVLVDLRMHYYAKYFYKPLENNKHADC